MLTGGDGADRFVLNRFGTGTTTVTDFTDKIDQIRLYTSSQEAKSSLSDLKLAVHAHQSSHTKITHSGDSVLIYMILEDISASDIDFTDFEIV